MAFPPAKRPRLASTSISFTVFFFFFFSMTFFLSLNPCPRHTIRGLALPVGFFPFNVAECFDFFSTVDNTAWSFIYLVLLGNISVEFSSPKDGLSFSTG